MRKVTNINSDWIFVDPRTQKAENVVIPHTWNAVDGQDGGGDYYRGEAMYSHRFLCPEMKEGDHLYIEFKGVNSSCRVFLNKKEIGSHDGGSAYTPQVNNLQQTPANTTTQHTVSTPDVTTSHYSRKRYRKPFNEPVDDYKIAGLSVGYVSKQWQAKADGQSLKYGIWEDSKQMNGLQIGVRVEPQFKFGFGINTGLYYEFYFTKSNTLTDDYGEYTGKVHEHCLYLPIHLEYRLNFSETFQAFFYGGIGLDCGVSASFTMEDEHNDAYDITVDDVYGSEYFPDWKRFNASFEYGAGIRFKMIQLNFTAAKGLVNMSAIDEYKVYQNKNMSLSLSMMF